MMSVVEAEHTEHHTDDCLIGPVNFNHKLSVFFCFFCLFSGIIFLRSQEEAKVMLICWMMSPCPLRRFLVPIFRLYFQVLLTEVVAYLIITSKTLKNHSQSWQYGVNFLKSRLIFKLMWYQVSSDTKHDSIWLIKQHSENFWGHQMPILFCEVVALACFRCLSKTSYDATTWNCGDFKAFHGRGS